MSQLEQLGNQDRNIILRVLPFMSIGLFLLLYVGNFVDLFAASVNDLKQELRNDEMNSFDEVQSELSETLDEWQTCALWCYAARLLSVIFLFTSFMMLLKWTLAQLRTGLRWIFVRCCCCMPCCSAAHSWKESCERKIHVDPVLQKQLGPLQEELEQQLGPRSSGRSSSKESADWNLQRSLEYLGRRGDIQGATPKNWFKLAMAEDADVKDSSDKCPSCRARSEVTTDCDIWACSDSTPLCPKCTKRRCVDVMSTLKLTDLDEFATSLEKGETADDYSRCERLCTNKGRQAHARTRYSKMTPRGDGTPRKGGGLNDSSASIGVDDDADDQKSLHELINTWRLMLATYSSFCKEMIDAKYRILSKQLQRDESHKQCSSSNAKTEISAETVGRIINNLSEFKADQKYSTQRAVMVVGALSCAVAPWIHTYILGCHDDRVCGAYLPVDLLNGTLSVDEDLGGSWSGAPFVSNSSNATEWTECVWLLPPCQDLITGERAYLNGSVCLLQPHRSGFDQPHECPDGEDPHYRAKLIAAFCEFTLTYSIFSQLLRVLRGYHLRLLFMEYFSQCVPWPGIRHTEQKHHAYGLLPRFELSSAGNIVAWNKIRCFLQTFEAEGFNQEQQKIFWVVLISLAMMITKAVVSSQSSLPLCVTDGPIVTDCL